MAQGYTRQSTANIVNGAVIDALYLNNEFNQIEVAMNAVSGHTHDGTSGQGGIIALSSLAGTFTDISGTLPVSKLSGVVPVSAGGTGVSGTAFTTSGQILASSAAGTLSVYTISGMKLSGSKFELDLSAGTGISVAGNVISHALTGSGAIVLSGAQFTLAVSAPLAVSGSKLELLLASGLKISGGRLDTVGGGGTSIGLIYFIGG